MSVSLSTHQFLIQLVILISFFLFCFSFLFLGCNSLKVWSQKYFKNSFVKSITTYSFKWKHGIRNMTNFMVLHYQDVLTNLGGVIYFKSYSNRTSSDVLAILYASTILETKTLAILLTIMKYLLFVIVKTCFLFSFLHFLLLFFIIIWKLSRPGKFHNTSSFLYLCRCINTSYYTHFLHILLQMHIF